MADSKISALQKLTGISAGDIFSVVRAGGNFGLPADLILALASSSIGGTIQPNSATITPVTKTVYFGGTAGTYTNFKNAGGVPLVVPDQAFGIFINTSPTVWVLALVPISVNVSGLVKKGEVVTDYAKGPNLNVNPNSRYANTGVNPETGEHVSSPDFAAAIADIFVTPGKSYFVSGRTTTKSVAFYNSNGTVITPFPFGNRTDLGPVNGIYKAPVNAAFVTIEYANKAQADAAQFNEAYGATEIEGAPIFQPDLSGYVTKGGIVGLKLGTNKNVEGNGGFSPNYKLDPVTGVQSAGGATALTNKFVDAGKTYYISGRTQKELIFYNLQNQIITPFPYGARCDDGPEEGLYTAPENVLYVSVQASNEAEAYSLKIEEFLGVDSVAGFPLEEAEASINLGEIKKRRYPGEKSGYRFDYDFLGKKPVTDVLYTSLTSVQTIQDDGLKLTLSSGTNVDNRIIIDRYLNAGLFALRSVFKLGASGKVSIGLKGERNDGYYDQDVAFDFTGGAKNGTVGIFNRYSTEIATSAALAYTAGDVIELAYLFAYDKIIGYAKNLTTARAVYISFLHATDGTANYLWAVHAKPRFSHLQGEATLQSISISAADKMPLKTVFAGDSITHFTFSNGYKNGFQFKAAGINEGKITNVGGGGYSTADLVLYAQEILLLNPVYVHIYIGTNDKLGGRSDAQFKGDLTAFCNIMDNAGINVAIGTLTRIQGTIPTSYNEIIENLATERNYLLIDYAAAGMVTGDFGSDNVHPNQQGHAKLGAFLLAAAPELFN